MQVFSAISKAAGPWALSPGSRAMGWNQRSHLVFSCKDRNPVTFGRFHSPAGSCNWSWWWFVMALSFPYLFHSSLPPSPLFPLSLSFFVISLSPCLSLLLSSTVAYPSMERYLRIYSSLRDLAFACHSIFSTSHPLSKKTSFFPWPGDLHLPEKSSPFHHK